ncbi:MAG: helix-turn-helix transcriptional regulator [Clostridia bacterium]|nr:helix-turn-helix transcriptional regulator [Clostridia bacterium]
MILDSNIIGNRIKKFREASGITQEQLGEKINLSRNQVSNLERGFNKLSYKTLVELCDVLNICPCELMCGADHKTVADDTIDLIKHMDENDQTIVYQMILAYKETKEKIISKK